eukprot:6490057-Amphidinium_carterae.1
MKNSIQRTPSANQTLCEHSAKVTIEIKGPVPSRGRRCSATATVMSRCTVNLRADAMACSAPSTPSVCVLRKGTTCVTYAAVHNQLYLWQVLHGEASDSLGLLETPRRPKTRPCLLENPARACATSAAAPRLTVGFGAFPVVLLLAWVAIGGLGCFVTQPLPSRKSTYSIA